MSSSRDSLDPLGVENSMDLLIVLLFTPGRSGPCEPIDGITRLQKLVFLLQQGVGPGRLVDDAKQYGYEPYKMGPYAEQLQSDLDELISAGIVITERLEYWIQDDEDAATREKAAFRDPTEGNELSRKVESSRFLLSNLGKRIGSDLWNSLSTVQQSEMTRFKTMFNSLSLRQLLIFTYERFPKFTTNSTIKRSLGLS